MLESFYEKNEDYSIERTLKGLLKQYGTGFVESATALVDKVNAHKWRLSESANRDVGLVETIKDYNEKQIVNESSVLETSLQGLLKQHGARFIKNTESLLVDLSCHKWYLSEEIGKDVGLQAAVEDWVNKYGWYGSPEILEIEHSYKKGEYSIVVAKLEEFVKQHKNLIEKKQQHYSKLLKVNINSLHALKLLLYQRKTIDLPLEIAMQKEEIEKEAWYRGEPDHDRAAINWAKMYACGWRDHYVLILEFILYAREKKFAELLNNTVQAG